MQDFYEHPHYDVENIANDVSLVKRISPKNSANLDLAKVRLPKGSVSYTPHIRPACLPARMAEDVDSEVIIL